MTKTGIISAMLLVNSKSDRCNHYAIGPQTTHQGHGGGLLGS